MATYICIYIYNTLSTHTMKTESYDNPIISGTIGYHNGIYIYIAHNTPLWFSSGQYLQPVKQLPWLHMLPWWLQARFGFCGRWMEGLWLNGLIGGWVRPWPGCGRAYRGDYKNENCYNDINFLLDTHNESMIFCERLLWVQTWVKAHYGRTIPFAK